MTAPTTKPLAIVGIGASAGGLVAFEEFLEHLPPDTGMAFVLVQHLHHTYESGLRSILMRVSSMPVDLASDEQAVLPNHIYVIPPDHILTICESTLKLRPRPAGDWMPNRSIDLFLESLAQDQHAGAIGVIFSGMSCDGTSGLGAIKREGGLCFAQNKSAFYDFMPRTAIRAGCVDFVLSPKAIARELTRLSRRACKGGLSSIRGRGGAQPRAIQWRNHAMPYSTEATFQRIMLLLNSHTGIDFSLYQPSLVQRGIRRRMAAHQIQRLDSYTSLLSTKAAEREALLSCILPSKTGFFHDSATWGVLMQSVLLPLVRGSGKAPLRLWVIGCSSGEEAYDLTIALSKASQELNHPPNFRLFATDVNEALLKKARYGIYAKQELEHLSPVLSGEFFHEEKDAYRARSFLREAIVFARHDVLNDPPFLRMDLISCRNLLLYLRPEGQRQALLAIHYALNPGGFVLLDEFATVTPGVGLFNIVEFKSRIFSKAPGTIAYPYVRGPLRARQLQGI